jgi:hypothetical protein
MTLLVLDISVPQISSHYAALVMLQLELNCLRDYLIYGQKYLVLGLVL